MQHDPGSRVPREELFHRAAGLADISELVRLRRIIFNGHPAEDRTEWLEPCVQFLKERLENEDPNFHAAVIGEEQVGGRLVACAMGWIDQHLPSPVSASGALGYVGSVTTDADYRGLGLGVSVFASLMKWFKEKNVPRVELQTTPDAVALYRKFDFEELPTPVLRWYAKS